MKRDISKIFLKEHLSDVTFIVGPERTPLPGHKAILAARCPKFEGLFSGGFGDSSAAEIELPDVDTLAFTAMLNYIYTNEVSGFLDNRVLVPKILGFNVQLKCPFSQDGQNLSKILDNTIADTEQLLVTPGKQTLLIEAKRHLEWNLSKVQATVVPLEATPVCQK